MTTAADNPPKSKRRWFRYSLRTLFVVVTLIAVFLGLVVRPAFEQRRIVAELEKMGVQCMYDYEDGEYPFKNDPPLTSGYLGELIGRDFVAHVTHVVFYEVSEPVVAMRLARRLHRIHDLEFVMTRVSDDVLREVRPLSSLQCLRIGGYERVDVTNAGLEYLKKLHQLETLGIARCHKVTDAGLASLANLESLKVLDLSYTSVTGAGLWQLQALPNMECVYLDGCPVTTEQARKLKGRFPKLEIVRIEESEVSLPDEGVPNQ